MGLQCMTLQVVGVVCRTRAPASTHAAKCAQNIRPAITGHLTASVCRHLDRSSHQQAYKLGILVTLIQRLWILDLDLVLYM